MKSERLQSLDAFRGFTIAAMILVNDPGSWSHIYPQLDHADWNGWTFTDWIFPFFLWIVGVAMTFSFASRTERGDSKQKLMYSVLRRSLIIFALGIFYSGFPFGLLWHDNFTWATLRIPGVLQRIAICYLIASIIFLTTNVRGQIIAICTLFVSYSLMMFYIPVPGIGAGLFEKGRNFAAYIDSILLRGHMWGETKTWDPEGVISTIPAIATTLLGILTGRYLRSSQHTKTEKSAWMFVFGAGFLLLGVILDMWMPINKKLWTVSYVIFMNGWSLSVFGIFYFLIDAQGIKKWAHPFIVYGMNAIFVYILSCVVDRALELATWNGTSLHDLIMRHFFDPFFSPINASLGFAILWVLCMYAVVWGMYRMKWFIKV
ncbi:MAG: DUF5009 domain-containing protein [Candidatus Kryptoniota bacterium]